MPPGPSADTLDEFDLAAAMAAQLAFGPAVHNAQMNIQVHGGIGFTWEHDAHLFLRRALVLNAVLGSPGRRRGRDGVRRPGARTRDVSLDLPPEAEAIRAEVRAEARADRRAGGGGAAQGAGGLGAAGARTGPRPGAAAPAPSSRS